MCLRTCPSRGLFAFEISLLPFLLRGLRGWIGQIGIEGISALRPDFEFAFKVGCVGELTDDRCDIFEAAALKRNNMAKWFIHPEVYAVVRTRELPVHGEGIGRPVGLDHA